MHNNIDKMQLYTGLINTALDKYLPVGDESAVCQAMRYSVKNGGKRIRPVLTLEFCRLCGGKPEDALPFACAVEMIHAYSLIHDDLPCMDNDDLRRGKPSCHIKFGEAIALLAGDALLTLAFETIFNAEIDPNKAIEAGRQLSSGAGWSGMIGGQVMDIQNEEKKVNLDNLIITDHNKTGKLIIAAAVLGCIAGGADKEKKASSALFSRDIGLAFQLVDDILDVTGDEATLGKPIGSDDHNQKSTYVTLIGVNASQQKVQELTEEAKNALKVFGDDAEFLLTLADNLAKRDK